MDHYRLAALLRGSLTGAARQAALAEMAALAYDELEVFADAAAVLREEQEQERGMIGDESAGKRRSTDPPALLARKEQANALRPHVTRWVEIVGVEAVAARARLKPDSIKAFIGRGVTPQPGALDAYTEMRADEEFLRQISAEMQTNEGS